MRYLRLRAVSASATLCLLVSCAHAGEFVQPTGTQPTSIVRCERNAAAMGNAGGNIRMPQHELRIPRGVLPDGATARFYAMNGDTTGVRIEIEPARQAPLATPIIVVIDARRCRPDDPALVGATIWRYPDDGGPPTPVPTRRTGFLFRGEVTQTSGFIIAN